MVPKFILEGLAARYPAVAAVADSEFDVVPERRIVVLLERCLPLLPIPVTVAWEMVRFDLPLLLTAINNVRLLPSWTLPKFTLEEERASWPVAAFE